LDWLHQGSYLKILQARIEKNSFDGYSQSWQSQSNGSQSPTLEGMKGNSYAYDPRGADAVTGRQQALCGRKINLQFQ
jgi:hypothetical protein